MVFGNVVEVIVRAKDQFSKTFNRANFSMKQFRKSALLVGAAAGAIAFGLGSAIKSAIDAQETFSKFSVVFKDVDKKAEKTAKNLAKNFGLSSRAAKELLGNTGDLLAGFGFTDAAALELSDQVNRLAVDLASFTNIEGGAERASRALTKALLGERESIKELGIAILEVDIKQRAYEMGILSLSKSGLGFTGTISRQEKALITLQLAVEQSENAIGDFARTQDDAANQIRIAMAAFDDLKVEIGKEFIPILETLLPKLTTMIEFFIDLPDPMKKAVIAVGLMTVAIGALALAVTALTIVASPWLAVFALIVAILSSAIIASQGFGRLIRENIIEPIKEATTFFEFLEIAIGNVIRGLKNFFSLGFVGGIFGGAAGGVPGFQHGGLVQQTGLSLVHQGERVIPRGRLAGRGGGGLTINIGELVGLDPEEISRSLREELFNKISL